MKLPKPLGARVLVEELVTSLSIRERGKRSGLLIITSEDDDMKNHCTLGIIVAMGTDPFLLENGLAEGKVVSYNRHAGQHRFVEGRRYRMLEFQMIEDISDELPSDARRLSEIEGEEL